MGRGTITLSSRWGAGRLHCFHAGARAGYTVFTLGRGTVTLSLTTGRGTITFFSRVYGGDTTGSAANSLKYQLNCSECLL
eukprot:1180018-Prorocentrum_minimum.AAC.1